MGGAVKKDMRSYGHVEILAAIERKDPDTAIAAMRKHLSRPADWTEEYRALHPDYFL